MKRRLLIVGALAACVWALTPQPSQAHWWRWGCHSYYRGYSYYPRYYSSYYPGYYSSYNSWSPYATGYGQYCSSGYSPYSAYGYYPSYGYSQPGYFQYGGMAPGLGGGSLPGLLAGANLTGSLVQPQYLSMPVSMGYGPAGYLQVPVGANSGRASYLQIPVNSGYGPSSYLQIELGRSDGAAAPAPSATPNAPPFGEMPGANVDAINRMTQAIPKTSLEEVPPVVPAAERNPRSEVAANRFYPDRNSSPLATEIQAEASATAPSSKFQLVSMSKTLKPADAVKSKNTSIKDTSFSFVDVETAGAAIAKADSGTPGAEEASVQSDGDLAPWIAK